MTWHWGLHISYDFTLSIVIGTISSSMILHKEKGLAWYRYWTLMIISFYEFGVISIPLSRLMHKKQIFLSFLFLVELTSLTSLRWKAWCIFISIISLHSSLFYQDGHSRVYYDDFDSGPFHIAYYLECFFWNNYSQCSYLIYFLLLSALANISNQGIEQMFYDGS